MLNEKDMQQLTAFITYFLKRLLCWEWKVWILNSICSDSSIYLEIQLMFKHTHFCNRVKWLENFSWWLFSLHIHFLLFSVYIDFFFFFFLASLINICWLIQGCSLKEWLEKVLFPLYVYTFLYAFNLGMCLLKNQSKNNEAVYTTSICM